MIIEASLNLLRPSLCTSRQRDVLSRVGRLSAAIRVVKGTDDEIDCEGQAIVPQNWLNTLQDTRGAAGTDHRCMVQTHSESLAVAENIRGRRTLGSKCDLAPSLRPKGWCAQNARLGAWISRLCIVISVHDSRPSNGFECSPCSRELSRVP